MGNGKTKRKGLRKEPRPELVPMAERIRARRKELGLKAEQVAFKAELTTSHYFVIEQAKSKPADHNLRRIARALKTTHEWLLTGEGEP